MRDLTVTIKLAVRVDDDHDTSEAVSYLLDAGIVQDAIVEYGADHGFRVEILRVWHDVERGHGVGHDAVIEWPDRPHRE